MKRILVLTAILFSVVVQAGPSKRDPLELQFSTSLEYMIQNMTRSDVMPGVIVAAPSKSHPDYFYHWVRDAALTAETALELYETGYLNLYQHDRMKQFFIDHLSFNQFIQKTSQRAEGLGEPKFTTDGYVYSFPWGRPQNDGPALRTLSLTHMMKIAINESWPQAAQIQQTIYQAQLPANSLVKADLEFIAHHWQDLNFDLWEEVYGMHFYTLIAQRKALAEGAKTANFFLDFDAATFYRGEIEKINFELEQFWNPSEKFILATMWSNNNNKSHLDTAVLLGVLHSNMPNETFSLTDDRVIATFQKLKDAFEAEYYINTDKSLGVAFGRYTEDTYDGYETNKVGNPWVLTTAAAAEYMYRLAEELSKQSGIEINSINQKFYNERGVFGRVKVGQKISSKDLAYQALLQNLVTEGDSYLQRVLIHRASDGSMSEQINRFSGYLQGAPNLTWSHASFLSAKMSRDRIIKSLVTKKGKL